MNSTIVLHRKRRFALAALLAAASLWPAASEVHAQVVRHSIAGDMFYNFYVPPVGYESVGAQLYPCPRPAPAWVGHTYYTYQPLMPHESLYPHHRVYWTRHGDAPPTRTSVTWRGRFTGHGSCLPTRFTLTSPR